jgi:hypothetical protein
MVIAALASGAYNALYKATGGQQGSMASGGQIATVAAAQPAGALGFAKAIIPDLIKYGITQKAVDEAAKSGTQAMNEWGVSIGRFLGVIPQAADNTDQLTNELNQLSALLSQVRANEQQERAFQIQKANMTRDFNIQEQYATEDFYRQRGRADRDFNIQLLYSEQDYNRQRMISARDFNIQMARNQEDYQISVSRNAQDHSFDMFQIAMTGDAWSYYVAQRSYNLQKSRAEEDFQRNQGRASSDFQKTEADAATDFNISRARQLQQYQIQQADSMQDFNIQRQRAADQFKVQMGDMQVQFNEERLARQQAFQDQILPTIYQGEELRQKLLSQFNQAELTDLQSAINAAKSGADTYQTTPLPTIPQYAEGGPVYRTGPVWAHAGEYIENPAEAAGRMGGGSAAGGRSGTTIIWNDHRTFDSRLSAEDRQLIQRDTVDFVLASIP